jgi:predicted nucleotidyltransferase
MITRETLRQKRDAILEIAGRYGAHDIRIFGSVARGDAHETSDVDLIVRFDPERSLLDHGGLVMDLQDLLAVKVDVIDDEGMRERFRAHVMREVVPL